MYISNCDGYQQQQPIVITRCFIGFTQYSDDYTILFNLNKDIKWLSTNCSKY